jgi:hypothetical protein
MPKFKLTLTRTQYREVEIEALSYDAAVDLALDVDREQWGTLWASKPEDDIEVDGVEVHDE